MDIDEDERRLKQLILHRENLPHLFRDGQLIVKGLPKNSRIVSMDRRPEYDDYAFTIYNKAFEPVEQGDELPEVRLEVLDTGLEHVTKLGQSNTDPLY